MKIEVFTQENCSYCDMIKSYLKEHNIVYEEKMLTNMDNKIRLFELKQDVKTVPQVFVNGVCVGGARLALEFFDKYKENLPINV